LHKCCRNGCAGGATLLFLEAGSYDAALVDAVKHFQLRHGLDANGSVGPQALRALNVPVAVRIKQLEASLERLLGMDFVFAEIRSRLFPTSAKSAGARSARHDRAVTGSCFPSQAPRNRREFRSCSQSLSLLRALFRHFEQKQIRGRRPALDPRRS
jgi:hypothetical protein